MTVRQVAATVHGRYLLEAPAEVERAPLLVGFHGYGENAERHLEELRRIPGAGRSVLCAVQALHPFYNRTGEVIACWMTRLDREQAILDNVRYVASVVASVRQELPVSERLVYLGFSQGAAMAYRAAAGAGHLCQGLIVLGGDVPPELEQQDLSRFPPVLLGRGTSEEWYDAAKMEHDVELLRAKSVDVRPVIFQGGHEWTDEFRARAGEFLREVTMPAS
ncbi:MAG TPA: phospholipase [Thermoanaerobaculia bacterium]|jgi:predicted esterase|nr:phospholipase [Thermoanaerobaculia bacterium]